MPEQHYVRSTCLFTPVRKNAHNLLDGPLTPPRHVRAAEMTSSPLLDLTRFSLFVSPFDTQWETARVQWETARVQCETARVPPELMSQRCCLTLPVSLKFLKCTVPSHHRPPFCGKFWSLLLVSQQLSEQASAAFLLEKHLLPVTE